MESKFLYAFFQDEDGDDLVAINPKDHWESEQCQKDHFTEEEWDELEDAIDEAGLTERSGGVFDWGPNTTMDDVKMAFDSRPDLFSGSEGYMKFMSSNLGPSEQEAPQTQAEVPPAPEPPPAPTQPAVLQPAAPPVQRTDVMRIQIGNHEIKIPMDVNTAMMLAQTFQAYAQYQLVTGGVQPAAQQPTAQPAAQPAPAPEKPKSTPTTPTADVFDLSNSMRGEMLDVHGQSVVKIEQGGKLIAETKPCATRDEAYDIANRFARMIPGMTKPDEIIRK